ncbi:anthranilate synthase component 2 [Aequitasia blattaphilus]|uniref:Aminodeoxychorismate/anthranilate synthase component II n=1 Tax=Aequitasia blattaphilus TaxID=2949332 RepID=A0ABT1E783_9FIRM|nr:aminodeoxychorismate/anthranilate synthase component II [Aequitasia blattaphilus]MCP1101576.1 aminodeoxychorismate/anthranilate synthase component II [Aequitasia blattaphilus]MCR8614216.1 aminodeoxychorismate/anthranilate synthase component II [Aequitasia blattaphilus]
MILIIDNYDSFTYNLYQMIGKYQPDIKVIRNDDLTVEEIEELNPEGIVLSPGPGRPEDAGVCEAVIKKLGGKTKILGICLGHQAICEAYGGKITYAKKLMHGKQDTTIIQNKSELFKEMDSEIKTARYHSLVAKREKIPMELIVIGKSKEDEVMAVEHETYPTFGIQFHPESILTPEGEKIIRNFMEV